MSIMDSNTCMTFTDVTNQWLKENNYSNTKGYIYLGDNKAIKVNIKDVRKGNNALSKNSKSDLYISLSIDTRRKENYIKRKFIIIPTFHTKEYTEEVLIENSMYSADFYSFFSPSGFADIYNIFPTIEKLKEAVEDNRITCNHFTTSFLKNKFSGFNISEIEIIAELL